MEMPNLIFSGTRTVTYKDRRADLKFNSKVSSLLMTKWFAEMRDLIVNASGEHAADLITGLTNGLVHHYKTGKSKAVKFKTVLEFCDATGSWPAEVPGLPPAKAERLTDTLNTLDWKPNAKRRCVFLQLTQAQATPECRALQFRHTVVSDAISDWLQMEAGEHDGAILLAEQYLDDMLLALREGFPEAAHDYHVQLHRALVPKKWQHLIISALELSISTYECSCIARNTEEFIRNTEESHRQLINKYCKWNNPSQFNEAMYYLDNRHLNSSQRLRELSS